MHVSFLNGNSVFSDNNYGSVYQFIFHRHPDPESRPIFALIIRYLNKPDEDLLNISEEDRNTAGTRASTLGYPLSDGINLYKDLQFVYSNASSN